MDYPITLRGGVVVTSDADLIGNYKPNNIDRETWDRRIGPFTRDLMTRSGIAGYGPVRTAITYVAQFVVWCHLQGMTLDAERIFSPAIIEQYIAVGLPGLAPKSRSTRRGQLRTVGRAVTKKAPYTPGPARIPGRHTTPPYTAAQVERFWEVARQQPTVMTSRTARAVVALGLGVGLAPSEHLDVTAAHVRRDGGAVVVDIPGARQRTVPCVARWAPHVASLAGEARKDGHALIGPAGARNKNRTGQLVAAVLLPQTLPPLRIARFRATWMVELLQRLPIADFMTISGFKVTAHLDEIVALLPRKNQTELHRLIGEATDE